LLVTIIILTVVALVLGILIFVVNRVVPVKVEGIEQTEAIAENLPGMNCGACGQPGCFAFAQALTKTPDLMAQGKCAVVLQDKEKCEALQECLGITLDAAEMGKKALIHCNGNSEVIYDYTGVETCKGAALLLRGYKKCFFSCLGFGDCQKVCPQDAISIKSENNVAVVNPDKCTGCGLCMVECPKHLIELVPAGAQVALLCNYALLKDIPTREKCDAGCIHCRKCFKSCEYEAVVWNKEKAMPDFDIAKCTACYKCVEACPNDTLAALIATEADIKEPIASS